MPYKDLELRKQKHKEYSRAHYERNKSKVAAATKLQRISFYTQWRKFKAQQVCTNCGFSHPAAIDFHHVVKDPTNRKLNELIKNRSFAKALEEVKKCVPLCANCHRIHHYEEYKAKKRRRKKLKSG